ncbi:MAG: CinA family protein [Treponema sp.]|jgi:PncC family amidohydrolase|nr:CinA family protein [Treponema sp.]
MNEIAAEVVRKLAACSKTLVTAESCTAGLVSGAIAAIPGASNVLWGAFITYMADAKISVLGVDEAVIRRFGAASGETAAAMARGALEHSAADMSAAVTGLAGPGGDGGSTPVGAVWTALAIREKEGVFLVRTANFHFEGRRNEVRLRAVETVLRQIAAFLDENQRSNNGKNIKT